MKGVETVSVVTEEDSPPPIRGETLNTVYKVGSIYIRELVKVNWATYPCIGCGETYLVRLHFGKSENELSSSKSTLCTGCWHRYGLNFLGWHGEGSDKLKKIVLSLATFRMKGLI